MVQFNPESREITIKVVYYGPALSGKTTNLQALFQNRITSYNVCYTKLLRITLALGEGSGLRVVSRDT